VIEQRCIQFTFKRLLLLHAHYNNSKIAGLPVLLGLGSSAHSCHESLEQPRWSCSFRSKNSYYFAGYKLKESRLATSKMARQRCAPRFSTTKKTKPTRKSWYGFSHALRASACTSPPIHNASPVTSRPRLASHPCPPSRCPRLASHPRTPLPAVAVSTASPPIRGRRRPPSRSPTPRLPSVPAVAVSTASPAIRTRRRASAPSSSPPSIPTSGLHRIRRVCPPPSHPPHHPNPVCSIAAAASPSSCKPPQSLLLFNLSGSTCSSLSLGKS
jgi:hypothetical protein